MAPMQPASDSQLPARQKVEYPYPWLSKALIALMATALLGAGLIPYVLQRQLVIQSGESLQLTAHAISSNLGQVLYERYGDIQLLVAIVGETPTQQANIPGVLTRFKEVYPLYSALSFADRHGRVVAATDSSEVGLDVSRTAWFRDSAETGIIQITDNDASDKETTRFAVTFSAPVKSRNGELLGVVHTGITAKLLEKMVLSSISEISKELSLFKSTEYQVLSGAGLAFIDSISEREDNLLTLGVPSVVMAESRKEGWVEEIHLRRAVPVITGFAAVAGRADFIGLPWRVLIRVDRQDALGAIQNTLKSVVVIQLSIFLPLCVALLYALRKIKSEWSRAREAENRAWSSEGRIRQTIATALDAVIVIDTAGLVVEWNERAVQMFGWERQEALGQCLGGMIVPPQHQTAHATGIRRVCETGVTSILGKRLELPALHRDGHELLVEIAITEGHLCEETFFTAFLRDITITKQAARRTAAQHEITKALASAKTNEMVFAEIIKSICESLDWDLGELWLVDGDESVLCRADAWHRLEREGETLLADTATASFSHGIGLPGRVWETGKPVWIFDLSQDHNLPRKQHMERAGLKSACALPLRAGTGEILGVVEFFSRIPRQPDADLLDILESIGSQIGLFLLNRRAAEQLKKSEILFANVVDSTHDAIIAVDKLCRVILYNQGAARTFGYESAEVMGRPFDILLPEPLRKSHRGQVDQFFKANGRGPRVMGAKREIRGRRKNSEEFFAEASIGLIEISCESVAVIVLRDITERKNIEEMQYRYQETLKKDIAEQTVVLEQARASAESANRTKSDFLAKMSHELRTPMHAILSFVDLGIEKLDKKMPEKLPQYLHRIRESGIRLLAFLNDLLDLSKLDAGKMTYHIAPQDLSALVRTSVEQLDSLIQQKTLTLVVREAVRPATVPCDAVRISQVLENLLSNAIKFTPEGRTITIATALLPHPPVGSILAREAGPVFAVTISDEGIGIPEDELETVFDQFVQSKKTKPGFGGTGLGLAICREIVCAHGGDIMARNNPGGGASLTFTLPQEAATLVTQET